MLLTKNIYTSTLGLTAIACLANSLFAVAAPAQSAVCASDLNIKRAQAVKSAFQHAWDGYSLHAFGHDELEPVTNGTTDSRNGWGASIFDALDTIIIMQLEEAYTSAIEHVKQVQWETTKDPSKTFETNIRYLGGLLSAYDLRPDPVLLDKAVELAEKVLVPAYATSNQIPSAYVDVKTGKPQASYNLILAEFGSMQLEFVRLSQLTGNNKYADLANEVILRMKNVSTEIPGLYPMSWNARTFSPTDYEETQLEMWRTSVQSMRTLLRSETEEGLVFLGEYTSGYKLLQSGELVCFIPGNLLLGGQYLKDPQISAFAKELMDSCYDVWVKTPTGLAPETWSWIEKGQNATTFPANIQQSMKDIGFVANQKSYDLRPETIESLFYFYRITGDPTYQDKAWTIFQAIEKYCRTASGYSRVGNVMNSDNPEPLNFEESDPNLISLNDYVFNTEAHPFKLSKPIDVQYSSF
ncbi:glycoside hydrolase [Spinellus fusiger]|nr:glycoside hydrolase [Spinellus fusiger]